MVYIKYWKWIVSSFLILAAWLGCGDAVKVPEEEVVPASGTVELDGEPAVGVSIRFTPINDTKSVGGSWAVTDDDGDFTVMHWSNKEGIVPGSYQVTFSKLMKPDGSSLEEKELPTLVNAKETIAPQWSNLDVDPKSGATRRVDIPDEGRDDLEFSITSAPKK